jgi:hypothetical protein
MTLDDTPEAGPRANRLYEITVHAPATESAL